MGKPFHKTIGLASLAALVCVVIWIMDGCGKKTLPIPPVSFSPPAVESLEYAIDQDRVTLSWSYSAYERQQGDSPVSGFLVYVSVDPLSDDLCRDCPLTFKRIGEVPYHGEPAFLFYHTLRHGYVYTYKVLPYSHDGVKGNLPMTIQFDYQ